MVTQAPPKYAMEKGNLGEIRITRATIKEATTTSRTPWSMLDLVTSMVVTKGIPFKGTWTHHQHWTISLTNHVPSTTLSTSPLTIPTGIVGLSSKLER